MNKFVLSLPVPPRPQRWWQCDRALMHIRVVQPQRGHSGFLLKRFRVNRRSQDIIEEPWNSSGKAGWTVMWKPSFEATLRSQNLFGELQVTCYQSLKKQYQNATRVFPKNAATSAMIRATLATGRICRISTDFLASSSMVEHSLLLSRFLSQRCFCSARLTSNSHIIPRQCCF